MNNDAPEENTELLLHLASVAKMTCAIQGYTGKFRTVHESSSRNPSAREAAASRRFLKNDVWGALCIATLGETYNTRRQLAEEECADYEPVIVNEITKK